MEAVQKIKCINCGWFVLSFELSVPDCQLISSAALPMKQSSQLDLAEGNFPAGSEMTLLVKSAMGKSMRFSKKLVFAQNGRIAVFEVYGTSLSFSISLVDVKEADE